MEISRLYAKTHFNMIEMGQYACDFYYFPEGISNGADWYIIKGGMQVIDKVGFNGFQFKLKSMKSDSLGNHLIPPTHPH